MKPEDIRTAILVALGWVKETRKLYGAQKMVSGFGRNVHLPLGDRDRQFVTSIYGTPNYLTDITAAVTLCDALTQEGWVCSMDNGLDKTWECVFYKNNMGEKTPTHYGAAATLSGAICESFLRVKGLWNDGDSAN